VTISADLKVTVEAVAVSKGIRARLTTLTILKGSPSLNGSKWFAPKERLIAAKDCPKDKPGTIFFQAKALKKNAEAKAIATRKTRNGSFIAADHDLLRESRSTPFKTQKRAIKQTRRANKNPMGFESLLKLNREIKFCTLFTIIKFKFC